MEETQNEKIVYDQKESLADDRKNLFDVSKEAYKTVARFLKEKVFAYRNECEKFNGNTEFVSDDNLKSFDILVQYSVIQMSFQDGKLIDPRIELVEGICRHGSLAYLISEKIPNFHWTTFTQNKEYEAYKALDVVHNQIGDVINEFVSRLNNYKILTNDLDGIEYFKKCVKYLLELIMVSSCTPFEYNENTPCLILDVIDSVMSESGPFEEYVVVQGK